VSCFFVLDACSLTPCHGVDCCCEYSYFVSEVLLCLKLVEWLVSVLETVADDSTALIVNAERDLGIDIIKEGG
jgi:hypothetical protein